MTEPSNNSGQGILSLAIRDKNSLHSAFMPFVKNGGIFIPTTKQYRIGDEVFLLLTLLDSKDRIPVTGRVAWVTPPGAQANRISGIGVQFSEHDKGATRSRIETLLAGSLMSDRPTHTM
jgi:type IV pilus assembly protein PilZ